MLLMSSFLHVQPGVLVSDLLHWPDFHYDVDQVARPGFLVVFLILGT